MRASTLSFIYDLRRARDDLRFYYNSWMIPVVARVERRREVTGATAPVASDDRHAQKHNLQLAVERYCLLFVFLLHRFFSHSRSFPLAHSLTPSHSLRPSCPLPPITLTHSSHYPLAPADHHHPLAHSLSYPLRRCRRPDTDARRAGATRNAITDQSRAVAMRRSEHFLLQHFRSGSVPSVPVRQTPLPS